MTVTSSTGESDPLDEVSDALELTVAVLEDAIGDLKASTKAAVQDERFDVVASDNERLRDLRSFAGEVAELLARWEAHNGHDAAVTPGRDTAEPTDAEGIAPKRYFGRAKRGTRTPEPDFRRPILEVLRDAGGSMSASDALDAVGRRMSHQFTEVDLQRLPSDDKTLRWRNTAQWSRNVLADDGHIDRSVRGVWTITPSGRAWLERRN